MKEWVYKATDAMVDLDNTWRLAEKRGFICRSAYSENARGTVAWVANVQEVKAGDIIHFYFVSNNGGPRAVGSFQVLAPEEHEKPDLFGEAVPGSALCPVVDPDFIAALAALEPYKVDPVVQSYVGWPIKRIGKAPTYKASMFAARSVLQEYAPKV